MLKNKIFPVTCHTDRVGKDSIFIAIPGYKVDGFNFIEKAIKKGASKIVFEKSKNITYLKKKYPNIKFSSSINPRKSLAILSSKKLNNPSKKLKIIAVTGTKGKTTTTFLIDHMLQKLGFKTALLGTVKNKILNKEVESPQTTMSADLLQIFFNKCVTKKIDYVVMEVSSNALDQDRVYGIKFDIACFTNLAPEHMDFYKNLNDYYEAKKVLFSQIKTKGNAIINIDDEWGKKLTKELQKKSSKKFNIVTISNNNKNLKSNFYFSIKENGPKGINLLIENNKNKIEISSSQLFGEFNGYNLTMAAAVVSQIKKKIPKDIFKNFKGVPGRLQKHSLKNGAIAFVDYAHNPSSFEAILKTLKPVSKDLIVVFGCGGDKDMTKRPVMGGIVEKYADQIILTNDNPRSEPPQKIASEIMNGIKNKKRVTIELDREKAIKIATKQSTKDSIIAILGKGHENYQIIGAEKKHFDDFEEVSKY